MSEISASEQILNAAVGNLISLHEDGRLKIDSKEAQLMINIFMAASSQAEDQRIELEEDGMGHLRTFLKTTLLGLQIVEMAKYWANQT